MQRGPKKSSQQVRVEGGRYRSRVLRYPRGVAVRPTMQRTKASVFDIVGTRVTDAMFVDLFAGAGAVGIEALSRGAAFVHFFERERAMATAIADNLSALGESSKRYRIHVGDATKLLGQGVLSDVPINIVFADPPYEEDYADAIVEHFDTAPYRELGLVIVEHRFPLAKEHFESLGVARASRFGDTYVTFLEPEGEIS